MAVKSKKWMERPMACVVLQAEQTLTHEELTEFLTPKMAKVGCQEECRGNAILEMKKDSKPERATGSGWGRSGKRDGREQDAMVFDRRETERVQKRCLCIKRRERKRKAGDESELRQAVSWKTERGKIIGV